MLSHDLIRTHLALPSAAIEYSLNEAIVAAFADRYVMRTQDLSFDLDTFLARTGLGEDVRSAPMPMWDSRWSGRYAPIERRLAQGHRHLVWEGMHFEVIEVSWPVAGCGNQTTMWWVGPDRVSVERFARHVAEMASAVEDEVLVFASGHWQRSTALRQAIRSSTFDSLVLEDGLAEMIRADFQRFLGARAQYEQHGVPWKRGALFLGPPGNGKTHCIKALLNELDLPCFYVQSFDLAMRPPQMSVAAVFDRARRTTPCALVFEDLDSLLTGQTRSFFLNELDGFADNAGVITIATTNHPERLDLAILERPSRFDRKYHFGLPSVAGRKAYLERWRDRAGFDAAAAAEGTERFSYAYLQELISSSLIAWMSESQSRAFQCVLDEQIVSLRAQMSSDVGGLRRSYAEDPTSELDFG